jgi:hypothetical protein
MTSLERLEKTVAGLPADRTPVLGGWLVCADYICHFAGVDSDTFWADPKSVAITAYKKLGMDGIIAVLLPKSRDNFTFLDIHTYRSADNGLSLDEVLERINRMPSAAEIEASFDFETEYAAFRTMLEKGRTLCGDMVYMPDQWGAGAKFQWYDDFGYENYFTLVGAYPEYAQKLMEIGGAQGYLKCRLVAQAVRDGLYPHVFFFGEDICSQRGPMVSPEFLKEFFFPQLKRGIEPLLEAGCKPVWHCDGDVRLLVDMLIDCGIQGFQGFQSECGVTLDYILEHRTREGNPLIIFGPMSVTTELREFTPDQVKKRVKEVIRRCEGKANLVLFTSSSINPDIPLANIKAMYEAIRD